MTRLVVLDSTPVGLLVHSRTHLRTPAEQWVGALAPTSIVVLPEIILYEVRRELVRLNTQGSVQLLDGLPAQLLYSPVTTRILVRATELWAKARQAGRPTAGARELDIDVILAATALELSVEEADEVIVATSNVGHLSQFVDARPWESIRP